MGCFNFGPIADGGISNIPTPVPSDTGAADFAHLCPTLDVNEPLPDGGEDRSDGKWTFTYHVWNQPNCKGTELTDEAHNFACFAESDVQSKAHPNQIGPETLPPGQVLNEVVCLSKDTQKGSDFVSCEELPVPLIVGNFAAFGNGPIATWDFATGGLPMASFVPTGALNGNGRGLAVLPEKNKVFYTELSLNNFGPTDFIRIAPFNNGLGGADIGTLPNPRPDAGIQDLVVSNGVMYALTGYRFVAPLQIFGLDFETGAVVSGPVTITQAASDADGFTVLPNGNFLINDGEQSCSYHEYAPAGAQLPTPAIVVPGATVCTGVDTDGVSLYFETDLNSFTQTTLNGALVSRVPVTHNFPNADVVEDIAVVTLRCTN
jgi:hypothetical protein